MIAVSLDELAENRGLLLSLSFPSKNIQYASMILKELMDIGVTELFYILRKDSLTPLVLGKGYRGLVLKARIGERVIALKILRTDASINGLIKEAIALSKANSVGVGPKLIGYSEHVLAMEFIEGTSMDRWLKDLPMEDFLKLKSVLRKCFEDARKLDEIGLDHGEISDAKKHIIVRPDLKPVIIDFGKASFSRKPANVTSLFSYISFGPHSRKILEMLRIASPPLEKARRYKRDPSRESFEELLKALKLI